MVKVDKLYFVIVALLYYVGIFAIYVAGLPISIRISITAICGLLCLPAVIRLLNDTRLVIVLAFAGACWAASFVYNGNYPVKDAIESLLYFMIGCGLYYGLTNADEATYRIGQRICRITAGIMLLVLLAEMALAGLGGNFLNYISHNYVSVLGLIPLALFTGFDAKRQPSIILALAYCALCTLAIGRGGVITALFILVATLVFKIISNRANQKRLILYILLAVIVILAAWLLAQNGWISRTFFKFLNNNYESTRLSFWGDYIAQCLSNAQDLVFGPNLSSIASVSALGGNTHNSLLQMHASFGLFCTALMVVISIKAGATYFRNGCYSSFTIFAALLLRSMSDRLFFPLYMEPLLYCFLFAALLREPVLKNEMDLRNVVEDELDGSR